jgi:hypothetical protein
VEVRVILRVVVWLFAVIVVIGAISFLVIDAMDKVESIRKRAPWIPRILERRDAFVVLLMVCTVLLVGDGYELLTKEIPEVPAPPRVAFSSPSAPHVTVNQLAPPVKEQCWVRNYAVPSMPSAGMATMFCNTTYKPPFSIVIEYDQQLAGGAEPITFPVGGEFAKYMETPQGDRLLGMFDSPTIIPNQPFSVVVHGANNKSFPLVTKVTLRAKNVAQEFRP